MSNMPLAAEVWKKLHEIEIAIHFDGTSAVKVPYFPLDQDTLFGPLLQLDSCLLRDVAEYHF